MKEKFTPGPWKADCDCFPIMIRAEKMDPDCHQDWVCNVGGDQANARLIAAAPDMYEALKACIKEYGTRWGEHDELCPPDAQSDTIRLAIASLAKADGTP